MKIKSIVGAALLAVAAYAPTSALAGDTEVSTTVGFMSNYVFRGDELGGARAYAGGDISKNGFYAGTFLTDVDDGGLEYDLYGGYTHDFGDVNIDLNHTTYNYSGLDNSETENGATVSWAGASVGYVNGKFVTDDGDTGYDVITVGYTRANYTATLGSFNVEGGGDYKWVELSFTTEVATADAGITIGTQFDNEEDADTTAGSAYIALDVSKTFNF